MKMALKIGAVFLALIAGTSFAMTDMAEKPGVYFVNLEDGQTIESPFKVVFGLKNFGVAPAGVAKEKTGHHHLLIDTSLSDEEKGYPLAKDENHLHFGGGQTEAVIDLPPGEHRLQLILGDANHVPFDPSIQSDVITVTVK